MGVIKPVRFEWDEGNLVHTAKHGVTREEIEHVLTNDPMVQPDPHPAKIEARWRAIGPNIEGRAVFIVFTFTEIAEALTVRPISARYMHQKEVKKYERQQKR